MSATDARPVPYDRIAYAKRGNMTLYAHGLDPWNPDDETSRAEESNWHPLKPVGEGQNTNGHPHVAHDIFDSGSEW